MYVPPHRLGFLRRFGLESGVVFERTTAGGVWTDLSFQFQMSNKEREICEF